LGRRVFAQDQWGSYLIYRFAGRAKVFIDGRSDFYGQDFLATYAEVADVKPGWDRVLKQYDVGLVLIPPNHALASVLQLSSDWKRVYSDSVAVIFERDSPLKLGLAPTSRCGTREVNPLTGRQIGDAAP